MTAAFQEEPEVRSAGVAFWEALAERYDVKLLYSEVGVVDMLEQSPKWDRVMSEVGRNPRHAMALYRYLGSR